MFQKNTKPRIEYIDLMKGVCIAMVVLFHVPGAQVDSNIGGCVMRMAAFHMPLFFFLSGIFFREYSGFREFFLTKINSYIVPFAFFGLLGFAAVIVQHFAIGGTPDLVGHLHLIFLWQQLFELARWFLPCLFVINILFYLINKISRGG